MNLKPKHRRTYTDTPPKVLVDSMFFVFLLIIGISVAYDITNGNISSAIAASVFGAVIVTYFVLIVTRPSEQKGGAHADRS